ncbi:MAG: RluA family pseudouridine synthase [Pacificimonas sp.]
MYEDNHLLVLNKPAGLLVQGDHTGDVPLVELGKAYIKEKYNKPGDVFLGVVHRLDRPVSGVVVLARTSKALARMNTLFQSRDVEKTYWALVGQAPPTDADTLVHWLTKNPKKNKANARTQAGGDAKRAELSYRLLAGQDDIFLLEVKPRTGRPHQIRVQLAAIDCPIRGDLKYGFAQPNPDASISLHAYTLSFVHPVKKTPLRLVAPPPPGAEWQVVSSLI